MNPVRKVEDEKTITMTGVYVMNDPGTPKIAKNSIIHKIVVEKNSKTIFVYKTYGSDDPDFIINAE